MTGCVRVTACAAPLLLLLLASCATQPPADSAPLRVGVIALNDFHGHLEPPAGGFRVGGEALRGKVVRSADGNVSFLIDGEERTFRLEEVEQARLAEWPDTPR